METTAQLNFETRRKATHFSNKISPPESLDFFMPPTFELTNNVDTIFDIEVTSPTISDDVDNFHGLDDYVHEHTLDAPSLFLENIEHGGTPSLSDFQKSSQALFAAENQPVALTDTVEPNLSAADTTTKTKKRREKNKKTSNAESVRKENTKQKKKPNLSVSKTPLKRKRYKMPEEEQRRRNCESAKRSRLRRMQELKTAKENVEMLTCETEKLKGTCAVLRSQLDEARKLCLKMTCVDGVDIAENLRTLAGILLQQY